MPNPQTTPRAVPPAPCQTLRDCPRRDQIAEDDSATARLVPAASIVQGERLLRLRDVLTIVGLSRAHVYNLIKQELFSKPVALGSNCSRWVQSEVQTWVGNSIVAARSAAPERRRHRVRAR